MVGRTNEKQKVFLCLDEQHTVQGQVFCDVPVLEVFNAFLKIPLISTFRLFVTKKIREIKCSLMDLSTQNLMHRTTFATQSSILKVIKILIGSLDLYVDSDNLI